MITPPYLKENDKVALVSTARKIKENEIEGAIRILKEWKLDVVVESELFMEDYQFAGSDQIRANQFQKALDHPEIKAIICVRGGYGTVRMIDLIDFSKFIKNPKWIVGYSDVTVLHSHIHSNYQVSTIHGTMPINFETNTPRALNSLHSALKGEGLVYQVDEHPFNRKGECEAEIIGGNLSILYSLIGSNSDIQTEGKILFIEDLDEYLYHVDRMMQNMKRAGKLDRLAGLIVGGMTDMNDNSIPFGKTALEIIKEATDGYNYPVCFGFPSGHINNNCALYFNKKAKLTIDNQVNLAFEE